MNRAPTLAEVAAAAGVSRMTVSRALNRRPGVSEPLRQEIARIAAAIGYAIHRPAQKLSGGRSRVLGLVAVQMHSRFMSEVAMGALRAARTAGYDMLMYSLLGPDEKLPGGVTQLLSQVADGVIALQPFTHDYLEALEAARVPVIVVDDAARHVSLPCIGSDDDQGARAAVRHLADLGHRRIGFVAGDERLASAVERRRAFLDVLAERGLPRAAELVAPGDGGEEGGYAAGRRLLSLARPPTAIFAASDERALGVVAAAQASGLHVPGDLSVVGFGDIPQAAQVHPPLTTVRQPMEQMGRSAVHTLLALLAGIDAASPVLRLPTELVVRASTAPPRGGASGRT